jgi:hypothetical protein
MSYQQLTAEVEASAAAGPPGPLTVPEVSPWFDKTLLQQLEQQLLVTTELVTPGYPGASPLVGAQQNMLHSGRDQQKRKSEESGRGSTSGVVRAVQLVQRQRQRQQEQRDGGYDDELIERLEGVVGGGRDVVAANSSSVESGNDGGLAVRGSGASALGGAVGALISAVDETRVLGELLARHIHQAKEELIKMSSAV